MNKIIKIKNTFRENTQKLLSLLLECTKTFPLLQHLRHCSRPMASIYQLLQICPQFHHFSQQPIKLSSHFSLSLVLQRTQSHKHPIDQSQLGSFDLSFSLYLLVLFHRSLSHKQYKELTHFCSLIVCTLPPLLSLLLRTSPSFFFRTTISVLQKVDKSF